MRNMPRLGIFDKRYEGKVSGLWVGHGRMIDLNYFNKGNSSLFFNIILLFTGLQNLLYNGPLTAITVVALANGKL